MEDENKYDGVNDRRHAKEHQDFQQFFEWYIDNKKELGEVLATFCFVKDALVTGFKKIASAVIVGAMMAVATGVILSYEPLRKIIFAMVGIKDD